MYGIKRASGRSERDLPQTYRTVHQTMSPARLTSVELLGRPPPLGSGCERYRLATALPKWGVKVPNNEEQKTGRIHTRMKS